MRSDFVPMLSRPKFDKDGGNVFPLLIWQETYSLENNEQSFFNSDKCLDEPDLLSLSLAFFKQLNIVTFDWVIY